MKKSKLLIKSILFLLGLIVCFGAVLPVESYAAASVTLDITSGSITIDADGYTQGTNGKVSHTGEYIITGTATTANTITVNGGNPTITFQNLNITRTNEAYSSTQPVLIINSSVTIKLSGSNKIYTRSAGNTTEFQSPRQHVVSIASGAVCTIKGSGSLTIEGCINKAAITGSGTFRVESGTVSVTQAGAYYAVGCNTLELLGGTLTLSAPDHSTTKAASVTNLIIRGGVLNASSKSANMESNPTPNCVQATNFTMSGGTLSFRSGNTLSVSGTANITGGNLNGFYTGAEANGRTPAKVYVVDDSGAAIKNKEVIVTIKEGNTAREWRAKTDSSGVITTYLGEGEQPIINGVVGIKGANGWTFTEKVNRVIDTSWTVSVPAALNPGGSGTVTAYGTWGADTTLNVTASDAVTLKNGGTTLAPLNVSFTAIALQGGDSEMVIDTRSVSVEDFGEEKPAPLFGEWTDNIVYTVTLIGPPEVTGITVTTLPTKTVYTYGETFEAAGMVVTATWSDGTEEVLNGEDLSKLTITASALTPASGTTENVSITYEGKETTLTVTVNPVVTGIVVSNEPTRMEYTYGETFDATGMVVIVRYSNGTTEALMDDALSNLTITPSTLMPTSGTTEDVIITYAGEEAELTVTVNPVVTAIEVTTPPTKTEYNYGDTFDPTDMVVTATYSNGTTEVLSGDLLSALTITPEPLVHTDAVTIGYMDVTTTQSVTVNPVLTAIEVTTPPTTTVYGKGDTFDPTGMEVTAQYSDDTSAVVTDYTVDAPNFEEVVDGETVTVTVSYEGKSAAVEVKVVSAIAVATMPENYDLSAFDPEGLVLEAIYSDGSTAEVTTDYDYVETTFDTVANDFSFTDTVEITYKGATTDAPVTITPAALNEYSWAHISAISSANKASAYGFDVGDTKSITINGAVGATTFDNVTLDAIIIGINHNSSLEGDNTIHFLIGGQDGKLIALVDEKYGENKLHTAGYFIVNTENTNTGGWASSHIRSSILGSDSTPSNPTANTLLTALPVELLSALKPVTKYTNNAGNSNNTADAATATTDYLFLLSEGEVDGISNMSSPAEDSFVKRYEYFKSNSAIAYMYNNTTTPCFWHLRSCNGDGDCYFSYVNETGGCTSLNAAANVSRGLLAGFVV